jgi:DNA mismatch repair protein MutS
METIFNLFESQCKEESKEPEEMTLEEKIELHLAMTTDKQLICNDINTTLSINQDISSIINNNILLDLELFVDNDNNIKNTVFNRINYTQSLFGENYLIEMLKKPIRDINILKRRQSIVHKMLTSNDLNSLLKDRLINFSNIESNIMWFWKQNEENDDSMNDLVYFNFPYLTYLNDFLNKNDNIMYFSNWYKIIITPVMTIFSPLSSIIVPLVVMKFMKIKIPMKLFFKIVKDSLLSTQKFEMVFGKNIIAKCAAVFSAAIWLIFYFQSSYSSVKSSKSTYRFIKILHQKVNMLSTILDDVEEIDKTINKKCNNTYDELGDTVDIMKLRKNVDVLLQLFGNKICRSESYITDNKGAILTAYHNFLDEKNRLLLLLKYIGKLDAFYSIAKLYEKYADKDNKYCMVEFIQSNQPYLKLKSAWHPYLVNNPIVNDIEIGDESNRCALITGPNAAGKSTFIKTLIMNIYLSQTIGIAAATEMTITPFQLIDTYLHIPDCKGRDSLFEAEMHRCKKYNNIIKNMKKDEFAFVVMDEMFSSTNYVEGYSAAYAILKKLSSYNNSLSLITTHYTNLSKLEKTTNGSVKNYNFYINRDKDNNIIYPYKIKRGSSDQYIALELLKLNNFDEEIIDVAIEEANKLQMKDKRRKKKILNKHKIIHKKTEEENKTKVKLEIIDI